MSDIEIVLWVQQFGIVILSTAVVFLNRRVTKLRTEWEVHKEVRTKLYKKLADPAQIEADFERSATAREMRDASRVTQPRKGAGPPAKIHKPKDVRSGQPKDWRIQRRKST